MIPYNPQIRYYEGDQLQRVPEISFRVTPALNLLNETLRVELDYQFFGDRIFKANYRSSSEIETSWNFRCGLHAQEFPLK